MDIDYRGITVEISSITTVTPQQATPSPRYYRKFHLQNRSISAVFLYWYYCRPHYRAGHYSKKLSLTGEQLDY